MPKQDPFLHSQSCNAPGRFRSVTDTALVRGGDLWAQARTAGTPTANPNELYGDVLIAAQALDMCLPLADFIIATANVGHLALFAPADLWTTMSP
jgi:hypothetical protein